MNVCCLLLYSIKEYPRSDHYSLNWSEKKNTIFIAPLVSYRPARLRGGIRGSVWARAVPYQANWKQYLLRLKGQSNEIKVCFLWAQWAGKILLIFLRNPAEGSQFIM